MEKQEKKAQDQASQVEKTPICGIIMPISPIDGCSAEHWKEVKDILTEAIKMAEYSPNLVSDADDSGVIQKRIVRNLYENEIVICDVSGKNPNVMFELGLRLAFDKPTIIVMDDSTDYIFDVNIIEHLKYPRDLSYYKILDFKKKLSDKINGTVQASKKDDYTTFLKHFGNFTAAKISDKEVPVNEVFISYLENISDRLSTVIRNQQTNNSLFREDTSLSIKENEELIDALVRKGIETFIKEWGMSINKIYNNENGEKEILLKYLEENEELRMLCKKRSLMVEAINYNLSQLLREKNRL